MAEQPGPEVPREQMNAICQDVSGLHLDKPAEGQDGQPQPPQTLSAPMARVAARPVANGGPKSWDITEEFTRAAAALEVGQLIKDDFFTLFESVAALEIMDPKMDSGVLQPGETLEDDFDIQRELLPEEIIWIMDKLLCYEVAWHEGYPLSQNLFTSIHLDRLLWPEPKSMDEVNWDHSTPASQMPITNRLLRAYCLELIKCCDRAIQTVTSRDYYEEEDFSIHTYNRALLTQIDEAEIWKEMNHCGENLIGDLWLERDLMRALRFRLNLRHQIFWAMRQNWSDPNDVEGPAWRTAGLFFDLIREKDSHTVGRPVPGAFSPKLQRRLASTVPPRPVVEYTFEEALKKMALLCEHSLEAVWAVKVGLDSPMSLLSYTWAFASRKPQPLAFPRALLASMVAHNGPSEELRHMLYKDLEELVLTEDAVVEPVNWTVEMSRSSLVPHDPRALMAKNLDDFVTRASQCYSYFWSTLCQNRCRIRRMLCHSLREFDHLMADAEVVDNELQSLSKDTLPNSLATWTYYQKLRQMEWVVQLGFEQEIYKPDELAGMYWWLSHIASNRLTVLEHILSFMRRRHTQFAKKKQLRKASTVGDTVTYLDAMILEARGTASLAECLSTTYALLHYSKLLPVPERPYSEPALRYELRMKPFLLTVEPPSPPPFNEYRLRTHPLGEYEQPSSEDFFKGCKVLIRNAEDAIKEAKAEFTALKKMGAQAAKCEAVEDTWKKVGADDAWKKNIASLLSSCIATGISVSSIEDACSKNGGFTRPPPLKMEIPEAGKRYHEWWIVPKVVRWEPK